MHRTVTGERHVNKQPWRREASGVPRTPPRPFPSAALLAFKKRTHGRCFICLALDHRAAHCRDPVRCFRCRRSGHKEARCPDRRPPQRHPTPSYTHPHHPHVATSARREHRRERDNLQHQDGCGDDASQWQGRSDLRDVHTGRHDDTYDVHRGTQFGHQNERSGQRDAQIRKGGDKDRDPSRERGAGRGRGDARCDIGRQVRREDVHQQHGSGTCKDRDFWPHRYKDNDDNDNDYDHPGGGYDGRGYSKLRGRDELRRERTRSPRPRDVAFTGGKRRYAQALAPAHEVHRDRTRSPRRREVSTPTSAEPLGQANTLPSVEDLRNKMVENLHDLFETRASALQKEMLDYMNTKICARAPDQANAFSTIPSLQAQHIHLMRSTEDYIGKVSRLAAQLGLHTNQPDKVAQNAVCPGQAAVPAQQVFTRLHNALGLTGRQDDPPTLEECERALNWLELVSTHVNSPAHLGPGFSSSMVHDTADYVPQINDIEMEDVEVPEEHSIDIVTQLANDNVHLANGNNNNPDQPRVDDLFASPAKAILQQPPPRRPRQRRTFDMTAVRRSARLAKKPVLPSLTKAQNNLYRKLGLAADEIAPIEQVLQQYIDTIDGPLPEYIIAALTTFLDLDNETAEEMTEALLQQEGEGIEDLQHEQNAAATEDE
ncbi:unnamed protein product [Urochloa humidicola]